MEMKEIDESELREINNELQKTRSKLLNSEKNISFDPLKTDMDKIKGYQKILIEFDKISKKVQEISKTRIFSQNEELNRFKKVKDQIYTNTVAVQTNYLALVIKEQNHKFEEQKKEVELQKQNFENQNKELTEQRKKIEEHDKNILNIMGIFLAIFSLIGFNISFLPEIPDYFGGWQIIGFAALINIIIVISISCLFLLINFITKK